MRRRANLAQLSPTRRAFLLGYRRAQMKARAEMRALIVECVTELADVTRELGEIRDAYHERLLLDAAIYERERLLFDVLLH